MNFWFRPLFQVVVSNTYYGEDPSADFDFIVPADTARRLAGGRLLCRAHSGQLGVFYDADDNGAAKLPVPGAVLRFGMKLVNRNFGNFTELPYDPNRAPPLYQNLVSPTAFDQPPPTATLTQEDELAVAGVFGVVQVRIDGSFYATAPVLRIAFQARQQPLKYYVVATGYSAAGLSKLTVLDGGTGKPLLAFTRIDQFSLASDDIAAQLLSRSSNTQVVLFKSQLPVARSARGRAKLQLMKNGDVLIPNLPMPGADQASADLFVKVSIPTSTNP